MSLQGNRAAWAVIRLLEVPELFFCEALDRCSMSSTIAILILVLLSPLEQNVSYGEKVAGRATDTEDNLDPDEYACTVA